MSAGWQQLLQCKPLHDVVSYQVMPCCSAAVQQQVQRHGAGLTRRRPIALPAPQPHPASLSMSSRCRPVLCRRQPHLRALGHLR